MSFYEKLERVHAAVSQPIKDSVNPHFNSKFASLNECNRVVSEAVRKVGDCDYWQRAVYNTDAKCWEMQTIFQADGQVEVLSSHPFKEDANPQKAASASTYARRYSLLSAFNLAAEDDDGNEAAKPQDDHMESCKRRMWEAIKAWAAANGENPNKILEERRNKKEWQDNADAYIAVAIEFEQDLNG